APRRARRIPPAVPQALGSAERARIVAVPQALGSAERARIVSSIPGTLDPRLRFPKPEFRHVRDL
ncbi:MAG: hypothetical protein ACRDL4_12710, partial [Thermoleophilaceae bacterium]